MSNPARWRSRTGDLHGRLAELDPSTSGKVAAGIVRSAAGIVLNGGPGRASSKRRSMTMRGASANARPGTLDNIRSGARPKCRSRMVSRVGNPVRKRHADNPRLRDLDRILEAPLAPLAIASTSSEVASPTVRLATVMPRVLVRVDGGEPWRRVHAAGN
jgi:hypothetical protein